MSPPMLSRNIPAHELQAAELERRLGEPLLIGNQADVFDQVDEVREALLGVLGSAVDHINLDASLLFAAPARVALVECLAQQCGKGVRLQILANATQREAMAGDLAALQDAGATLNLLRPPTGLIGWLQRRYLTTQRQLAVVDGQGAWCGPGLRPDGQDASSPHVYVRGAMAQCLQRWFLETWHASGSNVRLPAAEHFPAIDASGDLRMAIALQANPPRPAKQCTLTGAIDAARHDVFISMARRVPTRHLLRSLSAAAARGVTVSVLLPSGALRTRTWRRCCHALMGERVWIYQSDNSNTLPAHAIVDGVWSSLALDGGQGWSSARAGRVSSLIVVDPGFAHVLGTVCQTVLERAMALDARTLAEPQRLPSAMHAP